MVENLEMGNKVSQLDQESEVRCGERGVKVESVLKRVARQGSRAQGEPKDGRSGQRKNLR